MTLDHLISGASNTARPPDFLHALRGFMISHEANECSKRTLEYYDWEIRRFLKHHGNGEVRRLDIETYLLALKARGLSPQSVRTAYRALKAFFRFCVQERYIQESPLVYVKLPKAPKVAKPFLPGDALERYLSLCPLNTFIGARNAAMVQMLWTTGMRLQECAFLSRADLHWEQGYIQVFGKGAKERAVPFLPQAKKAVWRYLAYRQDEMPKLWLTEERSPLARWTFQHALYRLSQLAGIKTPDACHAFRRTWAMRQIRAGIPLKTVQLIGGWESIGVLEGYIRAMTSEDALGAKWC